MTIETVDQSRSAGPRAVQWAVVILLTVIATALVIAVVQAQATAQAQTYEQPVRPDGPMPVAVAGEIVRGGYGLYLVDPENQTILVYQYVTSSRGDALKLMAARTYRYDRLLKAYNTEPDLKTVMEAAGVPASESPGRPE